MDMVFHHLHGINLQIIRGRNLVKEILDRLGHLPDQQRLAVLGGPDDVILQVINGMGTCFVADLPCRFWRKANNFRGLFEFLLYYVATIKLAYDDILP